MPDKIDQLFDDLQSRGYAKDKTRKQFRDYMLAPGKQGYENRRTFFEDFKSNGETSLGSYEDFKGLLGLHATTKQQSTPSVYQKAQGGGGTGQAMKSVSAKVQQSRAVGQPQAKVEQNTQPWQQPWELDMSEKAVMPFQREDKRRAEAPISPQTGKAVPKKDPTKEMLRDFKRAEWGDKEAAKRVGVTAAQERMRDEMDYYNATGAPLRSEINIPIYAPTVVRDENGEMILGEDGKPLVGLTTDENRVAQYQAQERAVERRKMREAVIDPEVNKIIGDLDTELEGESRNALISAIENKKWAEPGMMVSPEERKAYEISSPENLLKVLNERYGAKLDEYGNSIGSATDFANSLIERNKELIERSAARLGMPVEDYVWKEFIPNVSERLAQGFHDRMEDKYSVKDTADFLTRKMNNSIIGTLATMGYTTKMQRQLMQEEMEKSREGRGKYYNRGSFDEGIASGLGGAATELLGTTMMFAADAGPMKVGSAIGGYAAKQVGNAIAKLGGKSLGAVIANSGNQFLAANVGRATKYLGYGVSGAFGMAPFMGTAGAVQDISAGDGTLSSIGQAFLEGAWEGAKFGFATGVFGVGRGELGRNISSVGGKLGFGMGTFLAENQIFAGLDYIKDPENFNWAESSADAFYMQMASKLSTPTHARETLKRFSNLFKSGVPNMPIRLTDSDKESIQRAFGGRDFVEIASDINNIGRILEDKENIPWVTRQKVSGYTMKTFESSRPRTYNIEEVGNRLYERAKPAGEGRKGELIEVHDFKDEQERDMILQQIIDRRANDDMKADFSILAQKKNAAPTREQIENARAEILADMQKRDPKYDASKLEEGGADYQAVIDRANDNNNQANILLETVANDYGKTTKEVYDAMCKKPVERTFEEQSMIEDLAARMHEAAYPEGEYHPSQSGIDAAEMVGDGPVIDPQVSAELSRRVDTATNEYNQFMQSHQDILEGVTKLGNVRPDEVLMFIADNYSGSERDEGMRVVSNYYNALAAKEAAMEKVADNIENYVTTEVDRRGFKGMLDGAPDVKDVITITDGEKNDEGQPRRLTLLNGEVGTKEDAASGSRMIDPEKSGGQIICRDENGEFVILKPDAKISFVEQVSKEDFANGLRQGLGVRNTQTVVETGLEKVPQEPTSAPSEEGKQQGAQSAVEAGREQTGADEAAGETPAEVKTGKTPFIGSTSINDVAWGSTKRKNRGTLNAKEKDGVITFDIDGHPQSITIDGKDWVTSEEEVVDGQVRNVGLTKEELEEFDIDENAGFTVQKIFKSNRDGKWYAEGYFLKGKSLMDGQTDAVVELSPNFNLNDALKSFRGRRNKIYDDYYKKKGENPSVEESRAVEVPTDKDGVKRYEQSGIDVDAAIEDLQKDQIDPTQMADAMISEAEETIKKIGKKKNPKPADIVKDTKARLDAQQVIDYWTKLKNRVAQQHADEVARKAAEEEAQRRAAAEAAALQARQKQEAELSADERFKANRERFSASREEGDEDSIVLANGETIEGRYVLVDADAVTPSHNPRGNFAKSEGFPVDENGKTINDRDYENDKTAQVLVQKRSQSYDQRAVNTPVVVSEDGIVLSGNDRTMSGQLAADNKTDGAYVDYITKHAKKWGFTPEQVAGKKNPRIVFVPNEKMEYNAETFAKFNQDEKKSQSKLETSVKMGKVLATKPETLGRIGSIIGQVENLSDLYSDVERTKDVLLAMKEGGLITDEGIARLTDENGLLSAQGKDEFETMLAGVVVDEDALRILNNPANSLGDLRRSIAYAVVPLVKNQTLGEYSIVKDVSEAVRLYDSARKKGLINKDGDITNYFINKDAFEGAPMDTHSLTQLMLANQMSKGGYHLKRIIEAYNSEGQNAAAGQVDMWSGGIRSKEDILTDILKQQGYDAEAIKERVERLRKTEPPVESDTEGGERRAGESDDSKGEGRTEPERKPEQVTPTPTRPEGQEKEPADKAATASQQREQEEYLKPRNEKEKEIVNGVLEQLQQEIGEAVKERDKAASALEKARAEESDKATDLFSDDNAFKEEGQLFDSSDMPTDRSQEGVNKRTSAERERLNEAQAKLDKLQSEAERNSRVRGALDNERKQTKIPSGETEGTEADKPLTSLAEVKKFMDEIGYKGSLSKVITDKNGKKAIRYQASGNVTPVIVLGETTKRDIYRQFRNYRNVMDVRIPSDIDAELSREDASLKEIKDALYASDRDEIKDILTEAGIPFADVIDSERGSRIIFTDKKNENGNYTDWVDVSDPEQAREDIDYIKSKAERYKADPMETIEQAADEFKKEQDKEIGITHDETPEQKADRENAEKFADTPITADEIDGANISDVEKTLAKAYLNGNQGFLQKAAYLKAYDNVRNRRQDGTGDSLDAEGRTQLDSGENQREPGSGRVGESAVPMDEAKGGVADEGQTRLADGKGQSDTPVGERGDRSVSGAEPSVDGLPSGGEQPTGGSEPSSTRPDVRGAESDKGSGKDTPKPAAGSDAAIAASKQRLAELRQRFKKASRNGTLNVSLVGMNSEQIEVLMDITTEAANLGYQYLAKGIREFKEWNKQMLDDFHDWLQEDMKWSDAEIDEYLNEVWNCEYNINGVTRSIREWASFLGEKELRKQVKSTLGDKFEAQKAAEGIEVKTGDIDNIRETLPFLLPEQQDDVLKAETQFFDESHQDREHGNGKGMMFTNGTGTGKTYTGLGIVKRFVKQGKGRVLILTPSQEKVTDWANDGLNLGLNVEKLDDIAKAKGTTATKSKGTGVVVTTYANARQNLALLEDCFDLIVYDESHKITEGKEAAEGEMYKFHQMLTNKDVEKSIDRQTYWLPEWIEYRNLVKEREENRKMLDNLDNYDSDETVKVDGNEINVGELRSRLNARMLEIENRFGELQPIMQEIRESKRGQAEIDSKRTKTVFLSATPFNTRENMKYAEGYLFSYPEEDPSTVGSYNHRSPEDAFLERYFPAGYRWRYGRLESHVSNAEALGRQEIDFSDYLQNQLGTLSGRMISSDYDYSRDFPIMTLDHAGRFNQAMSEVYRNKRYNAMSEAFRKSFDYNYSTALFEAMKTSLVIDRIKEHLKRGQKIVVFHRRRTSGDLEPPFEKALNVARVMAEVEGQNGNQKGKQEILNAVKAFSEDFADMLEWEKGLDYTLPRDQIAKVFGEDKIGFFSGAENKKTKHGSVEDFMKDNGGKDIIVIQEASGKEGISLHDQTGEHQRVEINLALPQSPIAFIQIEGRIYRIGQKSNAIFEYPLLGLDLETDLFAQRFNSALGTTENLALGSKARNLRKSIANSILMNTGMVDYDRQGLGGKDMDGQVSSRTKDGFDDAINDYYGNQKMQRGRANREGYDYFPTPEPVGFKMVEWGQLMEGESALEPSAGHGAIARYVPETNALTAIEPSADLFSKLQLRAGGPGRRFEEKTFEDYPLANKHDVIVMNPPYGTQGKMAMEHVEKAFKHLNEGGRLIAIIPDGPAMEKRFDAWLNSTGADRPNGSNVLVGEVKLPDVAFGRAGTNVRTRIVVIDKVSRPQMREGMPERVSVDLSGAATVEDMFEELRHVNMPERTIDQAAIAQKQALKTRKSLEDNKFVRDVVIDEYGVRVGNRSSYGSVPGVRISFEQLDNPAHRRSLLQQVEGLLKARDNAENLDYGKWKNKTYGSGKNAVPAVEAIRDYCDTAIKTIANVLKTTPDGLEKEIKFMKEEEERQRQEREAERQRAIEQREREHEEKVKSVIETALKENGDNQKMTPQEIAENIRLAHGQSWSDARTASAKLRAAGIDWETGHQIVDKMKTLESSYNEQMPLSLETMKRLMVIADTAISAGSRMSAKRALEMSGIHSDTGEAKEGFDYSSHDEYYEKDLRGFLDQASPFSRLKTRIQEQEERKPAPAAPQPAKKEAYEYKLDQNTKTGADMHLVVMNERVDDATYKDLQRKAKALNDGYYNRFKKAWHFKTEEDARKFMEQAGALKGTRFSEEPAKKTPKTVFRELMADEDGRFDFEKPVSSKKLREKGISKDLKDIKANKWNLPERVRDVVAEKLEQYMSNKDGEIQDIDYSPYFGEKGETTAKSVLEHIGKNSTDKGVRELASYLLKNLGDNSNVPVRFSESRVGARGSYYTQDHSVVIRRGAARGVDEATAKNNLEQTVIHEIAHAVTVRAIENSPEVRKEFLQIYKDYVELSEQYGINTGYAATNPKEFVAEFLGRKAFREALMELRDGKKSFGQRVLDFIKEKIFHISPKDTFFNKADDAIKKVLDMANKNDYSYSDKVSEVIEDRGSEEKLNKDKLGRKIPDDVEKSVSSQIEKDFDRAVESELRGLSEKERAEELENLQKKIEQYSVLPAHDDIDINGSPVQGLETRRSIQYNRANGSNQASGRNNNVAQQGNVQASSERRARLCVRAIDRELRYREARGNAFRAKYGIDDGDTIPLETLRRIFEDHNTDNSLQPLFDKAEKVLRDLQSKVRNEEVEGDVAIGAADVPGGDVSYEIEKLFATSRSNQTMAGIILHEMLHQGTTHAIGLYNHPKYRNHLSREQQEACREIISLYKEAKNHPEWFENREETYGLSTEYEFATEAANQELRAGLERRTFVGRLWDSIKKLFGFGGSRLERLDKSIQTLLDTFAVRQYRMVEENGFEFLNHKGKSVFKNWDKIGSVPDEDVETTSRKREAEKRPIFESNAHRAVESIKQEKATPEQWLKMIEKAGGLKAGEDKWMGLSEWLKGQDKKSLTKQEVLDFIRENQIQIEEVNYADQTLGRYDEHWDYLRTWLKENTDNPDAWYNTITENYGYRDGEGFSLNQGTRMPKQVTDMVDRINKSIDKSNPINSTRLSYTTKGLENKKEIALVVPTVESWNRGDEIHFGDAGNGRAVAWIRFGETEGVPNGVDADRYHDYSRKMKEAISRRNEMTEQLKRYKGGMLTETQKRLEEEEAYIQQLRERYKDVADVKPSRVLVIDEIQSKRHQEGREKGYAPSEKEVKDARAKWTKKAKERDDYFNELCDKYNVDTITEVREKATKEEIEKYQGLLEEAKTLESAYNRLAATPITRNNLIPDAPFEKNWHELAMKRMLRYAAENGYDKVAWTKGEQQADRYELSHTLESAKSRTLPDGGKAIDINFKEATREGDGLAFNVDSNGVILEGRYTGMNLSEVVGKDIANRLMAEDTTLSGEGLRIGGEGMKGFYDQMLPRFMDKYGKKWGVKTGEVELPNVEESGRKMWSVDVTPEMKSSVMQGQTMFKEGTDVSGLPEHAQKIVRSIEKTAKKLNTPVKIARSIDEVTNKDALQALREGRIITGWFEEGTGEIVLYLPNIADKYSAMKTVAHEVVGHHGLRELLGEEGYRSYMRTLWLDMKDESLSKYIKENYSRHGDIYTTIDEYLAEAAEKGYGKLPMWQKVRDVMTDALRKAGFEMTPSISDVKYMVWLSKHRLESGNPINAIERNALLHRLNMEKNEARVRNGEFSFDDEAPAVTRGYFPGDKTLFRSTPSAKTAKWLYEKALSRWGYSWKESHVDKMQAAVELMRAISGVKKIEDIPSVENFVLAENQMSSKEEQIDYLFNRDYMEPLTKAVAAVLPEFGGNTERALRNLQVYMVKKSGLERNRCLYVRDKIREYRKDADMDQNAVDQLEDDWNQLLDDIRDDIRKGAINLREYLENMDAFIRQNIDANYKADDHDYSGLTAMTGSKKGYDDSMVIDDVMDDESMVGEEKIKTLWEKTKAVSQYGLDAEYEGGLDSKEKHDKVSKMFEWYVPMRGYDETRAEEVYDYLEENKGSEFVGPVLMNAKGRESLSNVDIFAQLGAMSCNAVHRALKNQMKQSFARFVRNHYDKDGKDRLVTELKYLWGEKRYDPDTGASYWEEVFPDIPENATADDVAKIVEDFENDMKAKEATGDAKRMRQNSSIPFRMSPKNKPQHIVEVYINGEKKTFIVNGNPRAAQAINGELNPETNHRVINRITRTMAQLNTSYNPDFVVGNTERDYIFSSAAILAKESPKYFANWQKNYFGRGIARGVAGVPMMHTNLFKRYRQGNLDMSNETDRYFKEFMENGGETGWVEQKNLEKWRKEIMKGVKTQGTAEKAGRFIINAIPEAIEAMNERAENAARFATYMTSRQMGRSITRSVSDAKEVSVNFNRKGAGLKAKDFAKNGSALRKMNAIVAARTAQYGQDYLMFYNAGVQGLNNAAKILRDHPMKASTIFAGFALGAFLMSNLNQALIDDEDPKERGGIQNPYAELPEWIRRNRLCLYAGKGEFITVDLPIELRALYGIGDIAAAYTTHPELRSQKPVWQDVMTQITQILPVDFMGEHPGEPWMSFVPSFAMPFAEVAMNQNWYGRKIEKDQYIDENDPRWTRAYRNANRAYIDASKGLNAGTNRYSEEDLKKMGIKKEDVGDVDAQIKGAADGKITDPAIVEHIVNGYFGGAGQTAGRLAAIMKGALQGENIGDLAKSPQMPIVRRLHYSPTEQNKMARTRNKWWHYKDEMDEVMNEVKLFGQYGVEDPISKMKQISVEDSVRATRASLMKDAQKQYKALKKLHDKMEEGPEKEAVQMRMDQLMENTVMGLDSIR